MRGEGEMSSDFFRGKGFMHYGAGGGCRGRGRNVLRLFSG